MVIGLLICQISNASAFDPCEDKINITHKPRTDVEYNSKTSSSFGLTKGSHQHEQDPPIKSEDDTGSVKFPITVDLAERYGIDIFAGLELDAQFGDIEIDANNHIFYNGQDITGDIKDTCDHEPTEFEAIIEQETENSDNPDTGRELP